MSMPMTTRAILAVGLMALMTACSSTTAPSSEVEGPADSPAPTTTPAASAPAPSASSTSECTDEKVVAAIAALMMKAEMADPSRSDIADELERLTFAGAEAEARDAYVSDLRNPAIAAAAIATSSKTFRDAVVLPRC